MTGKRAKQGVGRLLFAGATCLAMSGASGVVGASGTYDTSGDYRTLNGDSSLSAAVNDFLTQIPWGHDNFITAANPTRFPPRRSGAGIGIGGDGIDGTYYLGGGQIFGDWDLQRNYQQVSVGTASLKSTVYARGSNGADGSVGWIDSDGNGEQDLYIQGTTEALLVGLDGVAILAHAQEVSATGSLSVAAKELIVNHYVSSDATAPASLVGGNVGSTGKVWTLPVAAPAVAANPGAKLLIANASAANNHTFDIVSVSGSTITTLQAGALQTFPPGATFSVYSSRIFVVDPNTEPTTAYGALYNGENTFRYVFNNSLDVLRVLYGGLHHGTLTQLQSPGEIGTFDAGSDVRRSLADSWYSLFSSGATSVSGGLAHAWRRSDFAGETDAFVDLVGFGERAVGPLSGRGRTNPFANAGDANGRNATTGNPLSTQFQVNSTATSLGGSGDKDFDPIRRIAGVGPNPASPSSTVDLDQVAENDGTLGLVLPIQPPHIVNGYGADVTTVYAARIPTAGRFDLIDPGYVVTNAAAPQGAAFSGLIFLPYQLDTSGVKHFNVLARASQPKPFGAVAGSNNRVFNLALKNDATGKYLKDKNNKFIENAFYRIHTSQSNTLVTPGVPSSGVVTATRLNAEAQVAALIGAEPRSIAYGSRSVVADSLEGPSIRAVRISGQTSRGFNPALATAPTDQAIKNLLLGPPSGTNVVYPLARRLYINTLVGFTENPPWSRAGIAHASGVDPGPGTYFFNPAASAVVGNVPLGAYTAVRGLQGQEAEFARLFQNSDRVGALLRYWGFVPLPSAAEGYAKNGISALDYPEDAPIDALPLHGAGEVGNPYAGHAVTGPPAFTNDNNQDATVVSPPDSLVPYSASGSSPPFPYNAALEPVYLPWPGAEAL